MQKQSKWKFAGVLLLLMFVEGCTFFTGLFKGAPHGNECAMPDKDGKPRSVRDVLKIGTNYLEANSYKKAFACFDGAIRQSPEGYEVNLKIGIAELGRARSDSDEDNRSALIQSAKKHLGKAFMNQQGHAEALYYLAEVAVLEKNYATARRLLSAVEAAKIKAGPTHALLGFIHETVAQATEAEREYRSVLEVGGPEATLKHASIKIRAKATFSMPPPLPPPGDARPPLIPYREFRLALFDFGRTSAQGVGERYSLMIPALLVSELKKTNRFALYEGGNLPGDANFKRGSAKDYVDGYLDGTVTNLDGGQVCFTLRLTNVHNFEILFARTICMAPSGDQMKGAVERLSKDIVLVIKKIEHGQVLNAEGPLVLINKGSKSGVIRGMVAYISATGELSQDPASQGVRPFAASYSGVSREKNPNAPVVGELYIVSVDENSCVGRLSSGDFALPGDTVTFK